MDKNGKKIGLALSGGGYRAAAYHIGTLRALSRLGILDKVDVISSISGGSIIAAYYALNKDKYEKFEDFEKTFRNELRKGPYSKVKWCLILSVLGIVSVLCGVFCVLHYFNVCSCVKWILIGVSIIGIWVLIKNHNKYFRSSEIVQKYYDKQFFHEKKLKDLPNSPIFAINSTEISQNQLMTFSKQKVACGEKYKKGTIIPDEIPISLAVMASSAYPLFSPMTIPSDYFAENKFTGEQPVLIDGGIYDNQGLHKLNEKRSSYYTDYAIVSNAGNAEPDSEKVDNVYHVLSTSIDLLMNRIEKMQTQRILYQRTDEDGHCAYVALRWNPLDTVFERYMDNIRDKKIPQYVYEANGLTKEQVLLLQEGQMTKEEKQVCIETIKSHVRWDELHKQQERILTAWRRSMSVETNLDGLSNSTIDALSTLAEWQTTLQVRLHLPHLCNG